MRHSSSSIWRPLTWRWYKLVYRVGCDTMDANYKKRVFDQIEGRTSWWWGLLNRGMDCFRGRWTLFWWRFLNRRWVAISQGWNEKVIMSLHNETRKKNTCQTQKVQNRNILKTNLQLKEATGTKDLSRGKLIKFLYGGCHRKGPASGGRLTLTQ